MNVEAGTIVTLLLAIIAAAVGYGKLQGRIASQAQELAAVWKVITGIRDEAATHEKESHAVRRDIDKDIAAVRDLAIKNDGRWEEVLRRLAGLDEKIDKLETREEKQG